MLQNAGDKIVGNAAEIERLLGIEKEVAFSGLLPSAEVDVASVAGLVREGFGGKGSVEPVLPGNVANRFPVEDVVVGGS